MKYRQKERGRAPDLQWREKDPFGRRRKPLLELRRQHGHSRTRLFYEEEFKTSDSLLSFYASRTLIMRMATSNKFAKFYLDIHCRQDEKDR